jgi:hypothetical protein
MSTAVSPKRIQAAGLMALGLFLLAFTPAGFAFTTSGTVYTTNGSVADVNAAIAAAPAGATVQIPPGNFTWGTGGVYVNVGTAVNLMGSGTGATTITLDPSYSSGYAEPILIAAAATVGNFSVVASGNAVGAFHAQGANGWRITNVNYNSAQGTGVAYFCDSEVNYGLIDNCTIAGGEGDDELLMARGPDNSWQTPASLGTANNVIVEDCTFNGAGYVCDANSNARFVVRFCTVTGEMKTDSHGLASNTPARGVRETEWYNNTWTAGSGWDTLMELRGGTGVVFNNTNVNNTEGGYAMNEYGCLNPWPNFGGYMTPYNYPIKDQVGVGQDILSGTNWVENKGGSAPVYSWNNIQPGTGVGSVWMPYDTAIPSAAIQLYQSQTGNPNATFTMYDIIKPNRDYFTGSAMYAGGSVVSGSFNGGANGIGIGVGTTAQMNAITPTVTGVGFWVTDQGSWNTQLAPNTSGELFTWNGGAWVLAYVPYTYPDPQDTGSLAVGGTTVTTGTTSTSGTSSSGGWVSSDGVWTFVPYSPAPAGLPPAPTGLRVTGS